MDPRDFADSLLPWLDGELPPERAAAMAETVATDPELGARVAAEREFEQRVRGALGRSGGGGGGGGGGPPRPPPPPPPPPPPGGAGVGAARVLAAGGRGARGRSGGDGGAVRVALARTRPATPPAAPHMFRTPPRWAWAAAASLLVAVGGMWYACIPPFECRYLVALEAAATLPAEECEGSEAQAVRRGAPQTLLGATRELCAIVPVNLGSGGTALRCDYRRPDGSVVHVLWHDTAGKRPSFRRKFDHAGEAWWAGEEDGMQMVAFVAPSTDSLVCVVGPQPEEELLQVAETLRAGR